MVFGPQQALEYVRTVGPSVPNQLRQALGAQDNFVVGAVLSELVGNGSLALTVLNHGTSKFYYDPTKPESLEPLAKYLNEKDQRAFQLLQQQKVVRSSELSPLNRVAVANIRDFSRPMRVETPTGEELFWRYYLVPEEHAFDLVVERYFPKPKQSEKVPAQPAVQAILAPTSPTPSQPTEATANAMVPKNRPNRRARSALHELKPRKHRA